jgi:hypothetical protein
MLVADDNKEVAGMFTDHPDILDFQRIHKVASINTLVHTPPQSQVLHQVDLC